MTWTPAMPWFPCEGESMRDYLPANARKRKGRQRLSAKVVESTAAMFRVEVRGLLFHDVATFRHAAWAGLTPAERAAWIRRDMATMVENIDGGLEKMRKAAERAQA